MKEKFFVTAIFVLMLCSAAVPASEKANPDPQPVLKESGGFCYAYMDFQGPYPAYVEKMKIFLAEFRKQNLKNTGHLLGVFYNDPLLDTPENYRWGVGCPISEDAVVKLPLKKRKFEKTKAVVIIHDYDTKRIKESNQKARKYVIKIGYNEVWPVYEIFHPSPSPDLEVIVEVIYPVEKK